uniref:Transcription factor bHLH53-like isoform X2 n=1 Tax=Cymbidium ensifolium TaxID=78740 RepID=A0A515HG71_CYMEN|nr:transcription factor bHLH53-like isoform X2 [Cymbidium ensifolium]
MQSVAARVLGRHIPGGSKMNTAEMLQAAFNYVKFLQTQINILLLMASIPKREGEGAASIISFSGDPREAVSRGDVHRPKEMVDELAVDPQLLSIPLISRSMDQFIQSIIRMEGCN